MLLITVYWLPKVQVHDFIFSGQQQRPAQESLYVLHFPFILYFFLSLLHVLYTQHARN